MLLNALEGLPHVLAEVRHSDERAARTAVDGIPFDIASNSPSVHSVLRQVVARATANAGDRGVHTRGPARNDVSVETADAASLDATRQALATIRAVWPELYAEMRSLIRVLVFFDESVTAGRVTIFTDSSYHGAILQTRRFALERGALHETAGDLLHEATHTHLNAVLLCGEQFFTRRTTSLHVTTFRSDPRPLSSVFHQVVVLARLAEYLLRAEEAGLTDVPRLDTYRPGPRGRLLSDELNDSLRVLLKEAPLTDYATEVVESVVDRLPAFR
ncbi:aKG-HExxH-type peptide beta-hydroxylase [Streptomyces sp. NPDC059762]|uniref:aKG-HExxH-type peptide beta-hydroxylase n=1 Tax=Streptomyces sp. NPDC059762 TaxID=3346938 RepID=UPI00365C836F